MSQSNRLHNVAVRGCLIAAALLCSIHEVNAQSNGSDQAAYAQEAAAETNSIAREFLSAIYGGLDKWDAVITSNESAAEGERRKEQREIKDLKAQERMAESAYIMVGIGFVQLLLSIGGIVLLARTLTANALSAEASAKSAVAAEKAAEAAERALVEHERPWIFRDIVTVRWRNRPGIGANDWDVSLKWKNVGRAPAIIWTIECKFADKDTLPGSPDYSDAILLPTIDAMPQGAEFDTQEIGLNVPKMKNGEPVQYVFFGRLTYKEMNGKIHYSGFAVELGTHFAAATSYNNDAYNYYN